MQKRFFKLTVDKFLQATTAMTELSVNGPVSLLT